MPETAITAAGMTVRVEIPGTDRAYTLHAPTFAEAGRLAAASSAMVQPSDAIFNDALRRAIGDAVMDEAERAAHIAAIDAFEAADDALGAFYGVNGTDRTLWGADAKREMQDLQEAFGRASRGRARAEWAVRGNPDIDRLRQHRIDAQRAEGAALAAVCLRVTVEDVEAMPAGDVATIIAEAGRLLKPSAAQEKN